MTYARAKPLNSRSIKIESNGSQIAQPDVDYQHLSPQDSNTFFAGPAKPFYAPLRPATPLYVPFDQNAQHTVCNAQLYLANEGGYRRIHLFQTMAHHIMIVRMDTKGGKRNEE